MSISLPMPMQRGFALLISVALALSALLPLVAPSPTRAAPTELFFSEYIEGSSNNKALEIYNGTGAAVDLGAGGYNVQMFFNGSASAGLTISLTGTAAVGDVFVLAQSSANATILAQADQTNGSGWFNGDDAVVLRHGTTVLDVVGQVGFDPGSEWGTGLASTADNTLRRTSAIEVGDANGVDAFDPAVEWEGHPTDTFGGLGCHSLTGEACSPPPPPDDAPAVVSTSPANGGTSVVPGANVEIRFTEAVDVAGDWFSIGCSLSGAHTAVVSGGPETYALDPDVDFTDGDACTVTVAAAGVTDQDVTDPPDTMAADHVFTFSVSETCDATHAINEVQGSGSATPISGQIVTVRGLVTGDFTSGGASGIPNDQGLRGFFIEAAEVDRDADPATSEGIFVFDGGGIFSGAIGEQVLVTGRAGEFGGVTQITMFEVGPCLNVELELPAPALLPLPLAPAERGAVLEPLESMRVTHEELTVTEFFQLERFGEVRLSASGVLQTPTNVYEPGTAQAVELAAFNAAATILLDDGRTGQNLNLLDNGDDYLPYVRAGETLRIGDQLLDHTTILHFGFNAWRLQPVDIDAITDALAANRTRPRPETPPEVGGTLKVASFNVLNYFDGDGQGAGFPTARGAVTASELARQTEKLVDAIIRLDADIYGLIEIENDGGAYQAVRTLVDALNAELGGEVYRFVDTGVIGTDAIKQAFIYDRWAVRPVAQHALLTSDVDPRYDDSLNRPALAQTFLELGSGERVTVVVNHFKSKGQSELTDPTDPNYDQGDGQGFWNHARTQAALALSDWLATNPTKVESVGTLIIGDLNAYGREDPIRALEDRGFEDQLIRYTDGTPYTYTFDGQQGTLDTALADESLASRLTGAAVWHINADEVPAIDYQESVGVSFNQRFRTAEVAAAYYDPSAFRSSDHDPVLVGIELGRGAARATR